jgi:hypothetical protein
MFAFILCSKTMQTQRYSIDNAFSIDNGQLAIGNAHTPCVVLVRSIVRTFTRAHTQLLARSCRLSIDDAQLYSNHYTHIHGQAQGQPQPHTGQAQHAPTTHTTQYITCAHYSEIFLHLYMALSFFSLIKNLHRALPCRAVSLPLWE